MARLSEVLGAALRALDAITVYYETATEACEVETAYWRELAKFSGPFRMIGTVPDEVHDSGWQWRPVGDGAFAPPFGTVRACDCGCLVAGGPTRCTHCAQATTEYRSRFDPEGLRGK